MGTQDRALLDLDIVDYVQQGIGLPGDDYIIQPFDDRLNIQGPSAVSSHITTMLVEMVLAHDTPNITVRLRLNAEAQQRPFNDDVTHNHLVRTFDIHTPDSLQTVISFINDALSKYARNK
jgi:hypothetical protein